MTTKRFKYTKDHIDYIRRIAKGRYNKEITEMFNKKFNTDISVNAIRALKSNHKIVSNVSRGGFERKKLFTDQQEEFLKENVKGTGNKELTKMFNSKFDSKFKVSQIKSWKKRNKLSSGLDGRFVKGQQVWNKGMKGLQIGGKETQFKKGQTPINYRPVGSERIDNKDGYIIVKVSDKDPRWKHKHVVEWEKHNGKVPKDHVVSFLDGNKMNTNIDNLVLLSRRDLVFMNKNNLFSDDPQITRTGITLVRFMQKVNDFELFGGDTEKLRDYIKHAQQNGIKEETFIARLRRGWKIRDAINEPMHSRPYGRKLR